MKRSVALAVELVLLFVALPLLLLYRVLDVPWIVPLAIIAVATFAYLHRRGARDSRPERRGDVRRMVLRFVVLGAAVTTALLIVEPARASPRGEPVSWLSITVLYPLLSVWPQEVIYRAFFFERYETLFGRATLLMSAIAFAFVHVLYENPIAVVLTLLGGLLFAATYARSRSLTLVWLEHSLYGILVFSIGLGDYFISPRFA